MHQLASIQGETTIKVRRSHSIMTGKVWLQEELLEFIFWLVSYRETELYYRGINHFPLMLKGESYFIKKNIITGGFCMKLECFPQWQRGRLLDILSLMSIVDDAHESQKGKHNAETWLGLKSPHEKPGPLDTQAQINDRDGLQRTKGELNNMLFLIPQLVYTVRLQGKDCWRTSQ